METFLVILLFVIGLVIPLLILVTLIRTNAKLTELIQQTKNSNSKIDTTNKLLNLTNKALGSVFRAIKSKK